MRARGLGWVLSLVIVILSGCKTDNQTVKAAKPAEAAQPLFTPEPASLAQQKMCADQAAKRFAEEKDRKLDSYTSHYDPTVNVCYIRVDSLTGKPPVIQDVVYDAFGGRIYANYVWMNPQKKQFWEVSPSACEIDIPGRPTETCKTSAEFDQLTEKYFGVAK